MAFCVNCGTKIEEGVKFCSGCGSQVGSAGVSINQEKAVNIIQAQPPVLPSVNPQNTVAVQTIGADEKYCFSCGSVIKKAAEICPKCGVNQSKKSSIMAIDVYCTSCGKTIKKEAEICPLCGVRQEAYSYTRSEVQYSEHVTNQNASMTQMIGSDEKYCFSCGAVIKKASEMCPKCGVNQNKRNATTAVDVYCMSCGKSIKKEAITCPFCGVRQGNVISGDYYPPGYLPKNKTTAIICWFFSVHRFYVGKIGTGILYILTFAGLGIWAIIDIILLVQDKFTDGKGYLLKKN